MTDDLTQIESAVRTYLDGLHEGDAAKLAQVFHPTSALTGEKDGKPLIVPRDAWLDMVRARPSPKSQGLARHDHVLAIDLAGTRTIKLVALAAVMSAALVGCMNMPTPTSQITGSYTSSMRHEGFDCSRLSVEQESLARRENQLVVAQEQRIKTSEMQAFWWGYGQGDGIEASELANVRGEKEAVRKAMAVKKC